MEFASDLCRVFVACNIPFYAAENMEFHLFFSKWCPHADIPDRCKISGPILDDAANLAIAQTRTAVLGWYATGQSDMWKNIAKVPVLSTKMNVSGQVSYTESSFTSFFNRHIPYALTTL